MLAAVPLDTCLQILYINSIHEEWRTKQFEQHKNQSNFQLTILLLQGVSLPGASKGLSFLFSINGSRLSSLDIWKSAAEQVLNLEFLKIIKKLDFAKSCFHSHLKSRAGRNWKFWRPEKNTQIFNKSKRNWSKSAKMNILKLKTKPRPVLFHC